MEDSVKTKPHNFVANLWGSLYSPLLPQGIQLENMATKPFKNSDSYPSELLEHELIDMLNWKGYFLCCKKCQETIPLNTGINNSSTVFNHVNIVNWNIKGTEKRKDLLKTKTSSLPYQINQWLFSSGFNRLLMDHFLSQDNDCAEQEGAWGFDGCFTAHLNGKYYLPGDVSYGQGIQWA